MSLQPEAPSEQEAGTFMQQGSSLPHGSVPLTLGSGAYSLLVNIFSVFVTVKEELRRLLSLFSPKY